jgi:hypothetical protein
MVEGLKKFPSFRSPDLVAEAETPHAPSVFWIQETHHNV